MAIATVLQVRPIHPLFGVEVSGVDLRHLDDQAFRRMRAAFGEHSVLVMHRTTVAGEGPTA
jgi:alpha-ketoglutarate-dependent taurine dioxygenase